MAMTEERPLPSVESKELIPEFEKDLKRLEKKFKHILSDLDVAIEVIRAEPTNSLRCEQVEGLGESCNDVTAYVLKKFRSTDLRSTNELRLVYVYENPKNKIILVQLYFKGDIQIEEKARIRKYFASNSEFKLSV